MVKLQISPLKITTLALQIEYMHTPYNKIAILNFWLQEINTHLVLDAFTVWKVIN